MLHLFTVTAAWTTPTGNRRRRAFHLWAKTHADAAARATRRLYARQGARAVTGISTRSSTL